MRTHKLRGAANTNTLRVSYHQHFNATKCSPFSSTTNKKEAITPQPSGFDARQLEDLRKRIGKCITFGLKPAQVDQAGMMLQSIARNWRELLAGSEGFLTSSDRRGLYRHQVVWGDQDSMVCHVNNVVYNKYAESARVNWAANYLRTVKPEYKEAWSQLWKSTGDGLILRSIRTDYKFPMTYPDRVTVYHKLRSTPEPGHDSVMLDVIILSEKHRRPAARCVEDIVLYDYRKGKKMKLEARPFMLDVFKETFELQEIAKKENSTKVKELISSVVGLEKGSWDREGAVEDFGNAQ